MRIKATHPMRGRAQHAIAKLCSIDLDFLHNGHGAATAFIIGCVGRIKCTFIGSNRHTDRSSLIRRGLVCGPGRG